MKKLLWVEIQKLRRSKIVWIAVFATVMAAVMIFFGGQEKERVVGLQNAEKLRAFIDGQL